MLLWHTWSDSDSAALDEVLQTFREIHPDVSIKQQSFVDMDEMLDQFQVAANAGLGPDLLITSGQHVRTLANAHLIDHIDDAIDDSIVQRYNPAALQSLQYGDWTYGLPIAMDTLMLYYDNRLVEQPATTLDGLLAEAAQGRLVAMTTSFVDAFWGVNAFGGSLFDEERRVILDQGGFANWLAWLKEARDAPGMLLDSNREVLRNRFIEDGVAYYVGYASEYSTIIDGINRAAANSAGADNATVDSATVSSATVGSAAVDSTEGTVGKGEKNIGVAVLPAGPTGGAAPFLSVQGLLFSSISSENQRLIALEFAKFLTNVEQQSTLMRETRLVPANNRVRVNPRLDPIVANFLAQARVAVPIRNISEMDAVFRYGGDAYTRVLEGVLDPAEASVTVTAAINQANGFDMVADTTQECSFIGTIYLGYVATARQEAALTSALSQLQQQCPFLIVEAEPIDLMSSASDGAANALSAGNSVEAGVSLTTTLDLSLLDASTIEMLASRLSTVLTTEGRLDLLLTPHRLIPALADRAQLRDLSTIVAAETLQRYRPAAVDAMRYQGKLYGLPMSINLDALYYNRSLVSEPAHTLDELLQQASAGVPVTLDTTFRHAFWGGATFGGRLLDEQGELAIREEPFINWLRWLEDARANANLGLTPDRETLLTRFINGEAAYYIAGTEMLQPLQRQMGADVVGVARLPSGPSGDAGPLLTATGLLFNSRLSETQMQLALSVANYLTGVESQILFFDMADQLPTNIGLNISAEEPLAAFQEQARSGVLLSNSSAVDLVIQQGNSIYDAALYEDIAPQEAVDNLLRTIDEALAQEEVENDE